MSRLTNPICFVSREGKEKNVRIARELYTDSNGPCEGIEDIKIEHEKDLDEVIKQLPDGNQLTLIYSEDTKGDVTLALGHILSAVVYDPGQTTMQEAFDKLTENIEISSF